MNIVAYFSAVSRKHVTLGNDLARKSDIANGCSRENIVFAGLCYVAVV
jgi:hypothetical protein